MRKLCSIQEIREIEPIEGADKIELAHILGWQVVVEKNKYSVGDKVVYCEIDTILPEKPEFEFLRPKKFRIKTIKLKGKISQGIVFPLDILPKKYRNSEIDTEVTEVIGATKYEPEIISKYDMNDKTINRFMAMNKNWVRRFVPKFITKYLYKNYPNFAKKIFVDKNKDDKMTFPSFIAKTDETRVQTLDEKFFNKNREHKFSYTEKIDGTSSTFYLTKDGKFGVCGHNYELKDMPVNKNYFDVAIKYDIKNKLQTIMDMTNPKYEYIAIQGEIIAPNIQKNKYKVKDCELYLFNVITKHINNDVTNYYNQREVERFAKENGFNSVPIIGEGELILLKTTDEILEMADGKSVINPSSMREGLVFRAERRPTVSFKAVSNKFLLAEKD